MNAGEKPRRGTVTVLHLRDGDVEVWESVPGRWVVSFLPYRRDHPDAPGVTLDSEHHQLPTEGGREAIVEWAGTHFSERDPRELPEVVIESEASEDDVRAVERLFDEAGVPAIVSASLHSRSVSTLPWAMIVTFPLTAFLTAFAGAAGADAWRGLKSFVALVFETRRDPGRPDGAIRWEDERRTVILTDRIPDDGFRQLTSGDLPASGYFVWDEEQEAWRKS
jgi:hypothetical protein